MYIVIRYLCVWFINYKTMDGFFFFDNVKLEIDLIMFKE